MSEQSEHPARFHFFVDGTQYETPQESLTGADIKKIASVTPTYQLFLETEGDTPDKPISDAEGVSLKGEKKHFFAVPPATFGA